MSFRIVGLDAREFASWFALSDAELAARGARRVVGESKPGHPCRVSLEDADVGEELLLLSYEHLAVDSPYRASGPIYVRRDAQTRVLAAGEVPDYVRSRLISLRAYDAAHMMVAAKVCEGQDVAAQIERRFADAKVSYIHLHNAKPGCFSCRVERA